MRLSGVLHADLNTVNDFLVTIYTRLSIENFFCTIWSWRIKVWRSQTAYDKSTVSVNIERMIRNISRRNNSSFV